MLYQDRKRSWFFFAKKKRRNMQRFQNILFEMKIMLQSFSGSRQPKAVRQVLKYLPWLL